MSLAAISHIAIDVSVQWSLCLSHSFIVPKRYKIWDIDTISSAYDSPLSLQDRVTIWLTSRSTSFSSNFSPKWPIPVDFERRRHSIANCCRTFRDSALVTMEWEPIGNRYRSFEWPPFPPKCSFKCTQRAMSASCRLTPNYSGGSLAIVLHS